ncbi:MAG: hypothetical protein GC192_23495 [Bacteroidetes bacterium]|nr:hypothetical protein [Bacteroidota bacterium]
MAIAKFNLNDAYKEVFGFQTPLFGVVTNKQSAQLPQYENVPTIIEEDYQSSVDRISPGTGVLLADRLRFEDQGEIYALPHETVISYHQAKNIVKTAMSGKDGTVKEYISLDDWSITIQGFIIDYDSSNYPIDRVDELRKWFQKNKDLGVVSDWLTQLGIYRIVVTDLDLPALAGFSNVQPFEIRALSDEPVELELAA